MLSLSLLFLSKSIFSEKKQILYKFLFLFTLIITSLSKESFLILTPAVLFLYLWLYHLKNNTGIIQTFKRNYGLLFLTTVLIIAIVILLLNSVGISQKDSYSGVNVKLFSTKTIFDFITAIFSAKMFWLALLGIFIFFETELHNYKLKSDYVKRHLTTLLILLSLMLLIIIPQFIIYYKSGFNAGRYYVPYLLGYSFLIIYFLKFIFDSNSISSFTKYIYLLTVIAYLFIEVFTVSIPAISTFSKNCKENTQVVNFLSNYPDKNLLIVFDPAQQVYVIRSLKIHLDYLNVKKNYKYEFIKYDKLNVFFVDSALYNKSVNTALRLFGNNLVDSKKENTDISVILIYQGLKDSFIEKNKHWFKESNYKKEQTIFYTIYYK